MTDAELAADLASQAGALLLALREDGQFTGKALGAEGDARANALLCAALRELRPDDALLSEEEADNPARCASSRVWIVDPLDGTREYGEGRDDWAVHVALATDGIASIGAVALPAQDVTFASSPAAQLGPASARPRMVVSRTRPPAAALQVAEALDAELIPMGSAGAKAMAVVQGRADIYLHTGGQYEWDNAAPVAVASAAGLFCSRVDGAPIRYNRADPLLPDLLICRPEWAERVLAIMADRAEG